MGPPHRIEPELSNFLVILAVGVFVLWVLQYCKHGTRTSELRLAVQNERWLFVSGLSDHINAVTMLTRRHLQQLLGMREGRPPVPLRTVTTDFTFVRASIPRGTSRKLNVELKENAPLILYAYWCVHPDVLADKRLATGGAGAESSNATVSGTNGSEGLSCADTSDKAERSARQRKYSRRSKRRRKLRRGSGSDLQSGPGNGLLVDAAELFDPSAFVYFSGPFESDDEVSESAKKEIHLQRFDIDVPEVISTGRGGRGFAITREDSLLPLVLVAKVKDPLSTGRNCDSLHVVGLRFQSVAPRQRSSTASGERVAAPSLGEGAEEEAMAVRERKLLEEHLGAFAQLSDAALTNSTVLSAQAAGSLASSTPTAGTIEGVPTQNQLHNSQYFDVETAESDNEGTDATRAEAIESSLPVPPSTPPPPPPTDEHEHLSGMVTSQLCVTPHGAYSVLDIFGMEEDDDEDCVVCLTEPKTRVLLPCRHLCVCAECFPHIDKCPVCRTQFETYLVFAEEDAGEETEEQVD